MNALLPVTGTAQLRVFRRKTKKCISLPQHLALLDGYVSTLRLLGHRKMKN